MANTMITLENTIFDSLQISSDSIQKRGRGVLASDRTVAGILSKGLVQIQGGLSGLVNPNGQPDISSDPAR